MTIKVGDKIPSVTLNVMTEDGPDAVSTDDFFAGKKVAIFGVPGAFTPTCSAKHLPGFVANADALKAKGVDAIACVSVNDPFVMGAWGESTGAKEAGIAMLGDADASFTKAMGMEFSAPPAGLIDRSKRYAMVVEDGVVTLLQAEESPGVCDVSGAESLLDAM